LGGNSDTKDEVLAGCGGFGGSAPPLANSGVGEAAALCKKRILNKKPFFWKFKTFFNIKYKTGPE
jgi:hypothetical protein